MNLVLVKAEGGRLLAGDEDSLQEIERMPIGTAFTATIRMMRSLPQHRKSFKLLQTCYDIWVSQAADKRERGAHIQHLAFNPWRKEIIKLAGYFDTVYHLDGTFHTEAHSLAFSEMEEDVFRKVISDMIDVLITSVLDRISRGELERIVELAE